MVGYILTGSSSRWLVLLVACEFTHLICVVLSQSNSSVTPLSPPVIISGPAEVVAVPGARQTLKCQLASGNEPVSFEWTRNDRPVDNNEATVSTTGELTIESVSATAGGSYRCIARNAFGGSVSEETRLTVAAFGPFAVANDNYFSVRANKNSYAVLTPPELFVSPESDVRWQWTFSDQAIHSNLTHYLSFRGELVLLNLRISDAGNYVAEATNAATNQQLRTRPFQLTVADTPDIITNVAPEIVLKPKDFQLKLSRRDQTARSTNIVLECVAAASSLVDVEITWFFNNSALVADGVKVIIEDFNRRLTIRNPDPVKDVGVYTCETKSGRELSNSATATVSALVAPEIIKPFPADVVGGIGQPIEISCGATGSPIPKIQWYFNGEHCCGTGNTSNIRMTAAGAVVINGLAKENVGVYQCEASNDIGSALTTTWLHVETKQPEIVTAPANASVASGQSLTLKCSATGSPPPIIRWQFNGTDVVVNGNNFQLDSEGNLVLPSATTAQTGWFTCLATNTLGQAQARAHVFVAGKAQITSGPEDQSVIIGSNVVFPCVISQESGEKMFARNWYFKNQLLTPGAARNIDLRADGSLLIRQVGPTNIGPYTCTVTSASGTQRQTGNLKIVEKPGMPLYVKAELVNQTLPAKVNVSWVEGFDGNSPIIKYLVEQRYLSPQGLWSNWEPAVENVGREQKNVLLDNLRPSTNYEFRVTAINRFGGGMASMPSNNVTLPQQPPAAAPQNADGSARGATSIMFQWQPPPKDQWNGDILGYLLRYRLANYADIPWLSRNITDPRSRNILLEDLITWREYEIQIAAYNERGMGVFSKSRYITTLEGVPTEAPLNVQVEIINSTAVYVSFTPPPQQMVPGVNLGYKVELWRDGANSDKPAKLVKVLPYSLFKIETVVNGLDKYGRYNVTVLCYTSPGDGPHSTPVEIVTKQDIPGMVNNFRLDEVLFSSIKLSWEHPLQPNGILTNYTLAYWMSNETETKKTFALPPNTTSYQVTGLSPSTRYSIDLYASTEVGRGPSQTANVESGVPPELPGPPNSLAVSNIQARTASLQFTPGFDGKTTISRWIVEGLVGASTNWAPVFNVSAPDARSFAVSSLRPYTSYRLRLVAENVVGRSTPSEPTAIFETLQAPPEYPPQEADAQPLSGTAIKVTWTPLQLHAWNGFAKGYVIIWQRNSSELTENATLTTSPGSVNVPGRIIVEDPGASQYQIENLRHYSVYDVAVMALNNIGQSEPSELLSAVTYEGVPMAPPNNLNVSADSSTTVRISWSPLSDDDSNGRIIGYNVYYKARGGIQQGTRTLAGEEQTSIVINGLMPFVEYEIAVAAFTIVGTGPTNSPPIVVATKEDLPGIPSQVSFTTVGFYDVRVAWKPPYRANGIIKHYSVAFWPQNSSTTATPSSNDVSRERLTKTSLAPDLLSFAASGLSPRTFYTFAVAAETNVGWGPETTAVVYTSDSRVPPPAPGRPAQSVTHPQSSRLITIVWDVSDSMTEPVRLFDVSYQRVNDDQWVTWIERVPGSAKYVTITNLMPNKAYRFRVAAVNDFGVSRFSPESDWIKTLEAEPSLPPNNVQAVPFEATGVRISWQAPSFDSWNSDFIGYRILCKPYNSNETVHSNELPLSDGDKKDWQYDVTGLQRFFHYVVQLQAFNQQGSSVSSTPVFVYVGYSVPKGPVGRLQLETLSSTQIRVSWPVWPQNEDPVNGFKINYLKDGQAKTEMQQDIARPDNNLFIIRDLSKFSRYNIEVVPFNKAGDGPPSTDSAETSADRPGQVGALVFSDILVDSVNVSWSPPSEPNGVITGYLVAYKTYKLEEEYIKQIQEKTTRNYLIVSNLDENVTLTFSVQAETVVGYGLEVKGKVTIGPQLGSPQAPQQPAIYPKETSVALQWENNDVGQGPIQSYIVQASLIGEGSTKARKIREVLISPNVVSSLRWESLATVESPQPQYTIPYSQLQPGGFYRFRVIARNAFGVSYPSPPTDPPIKIPDGFDSKPFYLEWWFLVILALVSLVIVVVIVAILYVTGKDQKFKYERRNSDQSLYFPDRGIVTYELRTSRRDHPQRNTNGRAKPNSGPATTTKHANHYARHPPPTTALTDPLKNLVFNGENEDETVDRKTSSVRKIHSVGSLGKLPNLYYSLGSGAGAANARPTARSADAVHAIEESGATEKTDLDDSLSGNEFNDFDNEEEHDTKDVSSIVQHYETSDVVYRETWRRAKSTAHRPASATSQQSDGTTNTGVVGRSTGNVSLDRVGAPPPYSRNPITNFSSFV